MIVGELAAACLSARLPLLLRRCARRRGELAAQDAWPAYPAGPGPARHRRGPGFYLAIWKILLLLLVVFWMWVKSADWVSRDSDEMGDAIGMPAKIWNPIMVFSFLLVF